MKSLTSPLTILITALWILAACKPGPTPLPSPTSTAPSSEAPAASATLAPTPGWVNRSGMIALQELNNSGIHGTFTATDNPDGLTRLLVELQNADAMHPWGIYALDGCGHNTLANQDPVLFLPDIENGSKEETVDGQAFKSAPGTLVILIFRAESASIVACAELGSPVENATAGGEATIAPTGTSTSMSTVTGKIAYAHSGDVYVMNVGDALQGATGTGVTRLTTHLASEFDPVWSPVGTQIAYRSHVQGVPDVYVMNADGSGQINLTDHPASDYSPAWSPDGAQIAFASARAGGTNQIWIMNADGSNPIQLTDLPGYSEYPTWSPDGRQLAFDCTMGRIRPEGVGDAEICVISADGTGLIQLTDAPGSSGFSAWSPDGSKIAFVSTSYASGSAEDHEIYIMNADGSEQVNLTHNPGQNDSFPAWSRDGRILFTREDCLIMMDVEAALQGAGETGLVQLSRDPCVGTDSGSFPDWFQPREMTRMSAALGNGCRIAFVDERDGQTDIFTTAVDGSEVIRLTNDGAQERSPVWSPDGTHMAYQRYEQDRSNPEITVMASDGSGQVNLTNNPGDDWSPAWSPDGTRLVFFSQREEGGALYFVSPNGSNVTKIPGTEGGAGPSWSPDGHQIVFRKELPGNDEIYVINADGTNPVNLTHHPANDFSPDWSPDGKTIVFESIRDGNYEIYAINPDGSHLRQLTDTPEDDQTPRWSPDGTAILYTHHGELYLMNPDGSNQRPLNQIRATPGNWAAWGPCEQ